MKICVFAILFAAVVLRTNAQHLSQSVASDAEVSVVVFLAVDCPISQKYIPALNRIQEKYKDRGVVIHSIIPGRIKKRDLREFTEDYHIAFAIGDDNKYEWVKALSANATPEVFVFDKGGTLKYRGAIDNWFYELGGYRKEATENYLTDAIEALLSGEDPKIRKTKALGCFIEVPSL